MHQVIKWQIHFMLCFDKYIGELNINNNSIIITADHGMQPKSKADGSPNAIYLQDIWIKNLETILQR